MSEVAPINPLRLSRTARRVFRPNGLPPLLRLSYLALAALTTKDGEQPTLSELSAATGIAPATLRTLLAYGRPRLDRREVE